MATQNLAVQSLVFVDNGQSFTTSLSIAEGTEIDHASVIKLVRTYQSDLEEFGLLDFKSESSGGRPTEYAQLNEQQSTLLLTYMRNSDIVRGFKKRLVKAFFEMAQKLAAPSTSMSLAAVELKAGLNIAAMLGCPLHLAQIESVKVVKRITGVDLSGFLSISSAQNNIQQEDVMLEPTEIGRQFGITANAVNKRLEAAGLQTKVGGVWTPTEKGAEISIKHSWSKGSKSGYNYKWRLDVVKSL